MELVVGAILEGKVTGITKFGAFVALPGGKSGLVHISNISDSYVNDVNDFLTIGQDVKVKVMNIDQSNRINLSIKHALSPDKKDVRTGGIHSGSTDRGHRSGYHSSNRGSYSGGNNPRSGGRRESRSRSGFFGNSHSVSKEPQTFEDKLKQYMAESESKLSSLNRYNDHGRSRRGRKGN